MLAWAISIHKSQGMTIAYLNVSFQGMFEYGQAYVALSRATDLEGLSLSSFSPSSIKAHDKVKAFYAFLGYAEESIHEEEETLITTIEYLVNGVSPLLQRPSNIENSYLKSNVEPPTGNFL